MGSRGRGRPPAFITRRETVASPVEQIEAVRMLIEAGINRHSLQRVLPPGGARNAVDCVFWDVEAKLTCRAVWRQAELEKPRPALTTFTCGANEPRKMATSARAYAHARAITVKLTGEPIDADRVRAVRKARPEVWLGVDANQALTRAYLEQLLPVLMETRVSLIEELSRLDRKRSSTAGNPLFQSQRMRVSRVLRIKPSYSRPRVSDDNAFVEALFRTAKHRPQFPAPGFADLQAARSWPASSSLGTTTNIDTEAFAL